MDVKFLIWNLKYGFGDEEHSSSRVQKERIDLAKNLVSYVSPNIFVAVEANNWDLRRYDKLFGFPYESHTSWEGHTGDNWGSAILSQLPITSSEQLLFDDGLNYEKDEQRRKYIRAIIPINGVTLTLDAIHPHPYTFTDAVLTTLETIVKTANPPHVIAGDLNWISKKDVGIYTPEERAFAEYFSTRPLARIYGKSPRDSGRIVAKKLLEAKETNLLIELGMKDAFEGFEHSPTVPTKLANNSSKSNVKLDHAFVSANIQVIDAKVLKDTQESEYASDHRPILVILRF